MINLFYKKRHVVFGEKMKKFTFKYSTLVWILLIAVALIFAASVAANIYDAVYYSGENQTRFILALIISTCSLALLIFTVSAAFYGKYVIKGKFLYFHFGFFFTKTDISTIFQLTEFKAQNKLVMYFINEKYALAVIDEKYYQAFYEALKKVNPEITYTVQSAEEE